MKIKEFFRLSLTKIILTIILFLTILFVPIVKTQPMCLVAPCPPFYYSLYYFINFFTQEFFYNIGNFIFPYSGVYSNNVAAFLLSLLTLIISYIISCLIIYIYDKIKRGKKKKK